MRRQPGCSVWLAKQPVDDFNHLAHARICDGVVDGLAVAARADQAFVAQSRQLLRHRGLARREHLLKLADRTLALSESTQDHQSTLVCHGLQKIGGRLCVGEHRIDVIAADGNICAVGSGIHSGMFTVVTFGGERCLRENLLGITWLLLSELFVGWDDYAQWIIT